MDQLTNREVANKLTDWGNEPSVQQLKMDFEITKTFHDSMVVKVDHWNDLLHVKGSEKPKKVKGRSQIQPKLIRRQAEWRYAALSEPFLSSKNMYEVRPTTAMDAEAAKQNKLVLNHQWNTQVNKVKFVDDYVRSAVDDGTVIVRVGWKRVETTIVQDLPVYKYLELTDEAQLQTFQQALQMREQAPEEFEAQGDPLLKLALEFYDETQQATMAVPNGTEKTRVTKLVENRPTYEIINVRNFYIDPTCNGDIDKALFVVISFETCKGDLLKEKKRYRNLDKVNWENNTPVTNTDHASRTHDTNQGFKDTLRKKVVAYEYWGFYDIKGNGELVSIVATWIGDVMIRMEENPYPDKKIPFVMATYLPVKNELFGEPDAELLEDNQKVLGALMRGTIDLMARSANSQIGFAKGMLDPLNRRRFENGEDYEFNPNMPPQAGMIEHKYPELPNSVLNMLGMQNQEAEALTGVKSFAGGISGAAYGDVVAGIRGALDAASKREMGILRRLAKGIADIGRKTVAMNSFFLSDKEVIRITDTEFVTVNREDLAGAFDLEVDISTAEIDDAKAKDLGFMLQTIGPNAGMEIFLMILGDIAELKRMPELAERLRKFEPKPDPMAEQLKQLELQKAQAEIGLIQAQIATEQAKARSLGSKADRDDLDFVEQESGTKHARDVEKMVSQSRGNQNLEVTKALTKPRKEGETTPNIEAAVGFNELSEILSRENVGIPAAV